MELIFDIIKSLNEKGTTILLVEQNALMALSIAHRGYVIQNGEIVVTDTAENLKRNEMVQKAYLGIELIMSLFCSFRVPWHFQIFLDNAERVTGCMHAFLGVKMQKQFRASIVFVATGTSRDDEHE